MYSLSYAIEVNPSGASPVLSAEQVWKGLEMKANNAVPFVPSMTRCEVVERRQHLASRDHGAERRRRGVRHILCASSGPVRARRRRWVHPEHNQRKRYWTILDLYFQPGVCRHRAWLERGAEDGRRHAQKLRQRHRRDPQENSRTRGLRRPLELDVPNPDGAVRSPDNRKVR